MPGRAICVGIREKVPLPMLITPVAGGSHRNLAQQSNGDNGGQRTGTFLTFCNSPLGRRSFMAHQSESISKSSLLSLGRPHRSLTEAYQIGKPPIQ